MTIEEVLDEVVDEILVRYHGLITSQRHGVDVINELADRGFLIVPIMGKPLDPKVVSS